MSQDLRLEAMVDDEILKAKIAEVISSVTTESCLVSLTVHGEEVDLVCISSNQALQAIKGKTIDQAQALLEKLQAIRAQNS